MSHKLRWCDAAVVPISLSYLEALKVSILVSRINAQVSGFRALMNSDSAYSSSTVVGLWSH